jgi:hypothetical protein
MIYTQSVLGTFELNNFLKLYVDIQMQNIQILFCSNCIYKLYGKEYYLVTTRYAKAIIYILAIEQNLEMYDQMHGLAGALGSHKTSAARLAETGTHVSALIQQICRKTRALLPW